MSAGERAEVAPDGSPVEVYRRLPPLGEAEIVHRCVPAGAHILEIGCGAGRVTRELVRLGHPVTAVDESQAMLALLPDGVRRVRADARSLLLGERFPVVLLGSHLVNTPDSDGRSFMRVAREHLARDGLVVAEAYAPDFDWAGSVGRTSSVGDVRITITRVDPVPGGVSAEISYAVDGREWSQSFRAERLDPADLARAFEDEGLAIERWVDRERGWLVARHGAG